MNDDVIQAWGTGKPAVPLNKLTFEPMGGFLSSIINKRW